MRTFHCCPKVDCRLPSGAGRLPQLARSSSKIFDKPNWCDQTARVWADGPATAGQTVCVQGGSTVCPAMLMFRDCAAHLQSCVHCHPGFIFFKVMSGRVYRDTVRR